MDAQSNRARRRARAVEVVEETTRVLRADLGDRAARIRRLNAYLALDWSDAAERDATALLAANPAQAKLLAFRAKLRILVHDTTCGGGATKQVVEAGGQTGPHQLMLREIEVY